jgi:predicted protein tyrosine phosphatase
MQEKSREPNMSHVHVCPLSQVAATVAASDASHLISVIDNGTLVVRPPAIAPENHLFLSIHDIVEPQDGLIAPAEEHVAELLEFVGDWDRTRPMVVHCFAGISRSTASAFIALCAVRPERSESEIAVKLRTASRFATPNLRLVGFADRLLSRKGRMVAAIERIGRGDFAMENVPFSLALEG